MKKSRYLQHDGTEKVFTSPRQEGTFLYFTSRGDNKITGVRGKGQKLILDSSIPYVNNKKVVEASFIDNIFIKDGIIFWDNAMIGDNITLEVVLPANTPYPFNSGNAEIINGVPTYITDSPTPNETWIGSYLLSPVDTVLVRFVNEFHILGSNHVGLVLESSDTAEVSKELKIRFTLESQSNSDITIMFNLELYRSKTV